MDFQPAFADENPSITVRFLDLWSDGIGLENANLRGVNPHPLDPSEQAGMTPLQPPKTEPTHPAPLPSNRYLLAMPTTARTPDPDENQVAASQQAYMDAFRTRQRQEGIRRVSATFNASEYARLEGSATVHGEKITTHLKTLAMAHLNERYLVPPNMIERADALLSVLRGVGNNLNQLARYSNEMRYFLDTEEVRLQVKRLTEEVKVFIEKPNLKNKPGQES